MLDDLTTDASDKTVHSVVHGVIRLEELALPCYYACKELNLNIPKDLKLITYSNLSHAELLNPPLSTINQPAFEIGNEAATILFRMFSKRWYEPNITISLKSSIIKRESTQS